MPDYYDKAVEHFIQNPYSIVGAWASPETHTGGHLFAYATKTRCFEEVVKNKNCGCIVTIRRCPKHFLAATESLTRAILEDESIPNTHTNINETNLPVFAKWQRHIDKELGREEPQWPTTTAEQ